MFLLYLSGFLVIFVFYVDSNNDTSNNSNGEISTKIIAENGSTYTCPYSGDVVLRDGENITVEMTHTSHINLASVTLPSSDTVNIKGGHALKKTKKFQISRRSAGNWSFSTLTNRGSTGVPAPGLHRIMYNNETYYQFLCNYNIKVKTSPEDKPKEDNNWIYYVIGGSVLAIIIVIQTIVILYILKTKKVRRIEQLALSNNTRSANDTARYSTTPGLKPSVKPKPNEDAGSIYESLDVIQNPANDAPPPPPIETLPRPSKKDKVPLIPSNSSQISTPIMPRTEEERIRNRAPMPLPAIKDSDIPSFLPPNNVPTAAAAHPRTETNISVTMPWGPVKPKKPAFVPAQLPSSPDRPAPKISRKPSAVNQDPIANELNNILKKRQTGNIPLKPNKPLDVPEPIPETKPKLPFPTSQGLRPAIMSKPPLTPAKQQLRPVGPKKVPGLPKPPVSPTQQPLLSPKPGPIRKWPPVNSQGTPPNPTPLPLHQTPHQGHGNTLHSQGYPMPQQNWVPGTQKPPQNMAARHVPVLPADGPEEEAEYAAYAEYNVDDDDEWTYEPLPHCPEHNIYMNASANSHG